MEVKKINISVASPPSTTGAKSSPAGFAGIFDSSLARTGQNQNAEGKAGISRDQSTREKNNFIKIGKITSTQPTVSHLSINHPEYGQKCWEIIHSDLNKDKPYTRIPEGTKIYLDPETKEFVWDNSKQKAQTFDFSTNQPSNHVLKTTDRLSFSAGQKTNVREQNLIGQTVSQASAKYNLPRELIMAVIKAESDFQARAVSSAGAQGLMQLMPATARELGVKNSFDIRENIEGGVRYLKKLLDIFSGNLEEALAAYNAVPGAVKKYQGKVPFQETRLYVQRVLSFLSHFK
jgi:hypothetical protein